MDNDESTVQAGSEIDLLAHSSLLNLSQKEEKKLNVQQCTRTDPQQSTVNGSPGYGDTLELDVMEAAAGRD